MWLVYILATNTVYSQNISTGCVSNSLGNSVVANTGFWSVLANPSSSVVSKNNSIGVDVENNFMINELSTYTLAGLYKLDEFGDVTGYIQHFGFTTYSINIASVGISKSINSSNFFSVHLNNKWENLKTDELSYTNYIPGFQLGYFSVITDDFHFGSTLIYSVNFNKNTKNETMFSVGFAYYPSKNVKFLLSVNRKDLNVISVNAGAEYSYDRLRIRGGYSSNPKNIFIGFGINFDSVYVDLAFGFHQNLGNSSGISTNYVFN